MVADFLFIVRGSRLMLWVPRKERNCLVLFSGSQGAMAIFGPRHCVGQLSRTAGSCTRFSPWPTSGCYSLPNDMDKGYPEFGYYLNQTGRPMLYACSWPVYQTYSGMTVSSTCME